MRHRSKIILLSSLITFTVNNIFQDECNANCYEIEVITAKDPKSGTDDKIEIQLEGQNGTFSEWFKLDSPRWFYNDFETDLKTTYYAQVGFQVKI